MIQYKFSFPLACCVLALIALALGFSNRKDGMLASFVIGISVSFVYYVLLYMARAAAHRRRAEPRPGALDSAPWCWAPIGVALLFWRARSTDRPILITLPARRAPRSCPPRRVSPCRCTMPSPCRAAAPRGVRRPGAALQPAVAEHPGRLHVAPVPAGVRADGSGGARRSSTSRPSSTWRTSCFAARRRRRCCCSTSTTRRRSTCTTSFRSPGLVATLVTIGAMTKNSELVVMRACGVSLYRTAVPLLLFAARGQRRPVRHAGDRARPREPGGRPAEQHHPRLPRPDAQRAEPLDGERKRATSITTTTSTRAPIASRASRAIISTSRRGG